MPDYVRGGKNVMIKSQNSKHKIYWKKKHLHILEFIYIDLYLNKPASHGILLP